MAATRSAAQGGEPTTASTRRRVSPGSEPERVRDHRREQRRERDRDGGHHQSAGRGLVDVESSGSSFLGLLLQQINLGT
jgi:hypothetical protein